MTDASTQVRYRAVCASVLTRALMRAVVRRPTARCLRAWVAALTRCTRRTCAGYHTALVLVASGRTIALFEVRLSALCAASSDKAVATATASGKLKGVAWAPRGDQSAADARLCASIHVNFSFSGSDRMREPHELACSRTTCPTS